MYLDGFGCQGIFFFALDRIRVPSLQAWTVTNCRVVHRKMNIRYLRSLPTKMFQGTRCVVDAGTRPTVLSMVYGR